MKAAYCLFLLMTVAVGGRFLLEYSRAVMETRQQADHFMDRAEDRAVDRLSDSHASSAIRNRLPDHTALQSPEIAAVAEPAAAAGESDADPVPVPEAAGPAPFL